MRGLKAMIVEIVQTFKREPLKTQVRVILVSNIIVIVGLVCNTLNHY